MPLENALAAARWFNLQFPIYAMISAVIVSDLSSTETRKLGPARMAGTILGALIGASIHILLPSGAWAIALGIFIAMFVSRLLNLRDAKLAGYVAGIVLLDHGHQPWTYAFLRVVETGLGIIAAILVSLIPKLISDDAIETDILINLATEVVHPRTKSLPNLYREVADLVMKHIDKLKPSGVLQIEGRAANKFSKRCSGNKLGTS